MYGLKKHTKQDKGGMIRGAGTGTSDDIKKNVPAGSYIMPADSTQQIGTNNLKNMGNPTPVNLSNGEFEMSPDQVHSVGVQALDAMKDQTHTEVDQPQVGYGVNKKPELFFANGGGVPEYLKRNDQNPLMTKGVQSTLGIGFNKQLGTPVAPQSTPASNGGTINPLGKSKVFTPEKMDFNRDDGSVNPLTGAVNVVGGLGKAALGAVGGLTAGAGEAVRSTAATLGGAENPNRGNMVGPSLDFVGEGLDDSQRGLRQIFGLTPKTSSAASIPPPVTKQTNPTKAADSAAQVAEKSKVDTTSNTATNPVKSTNIQAQVAVPSAFNDSPTQNTNQPAGNPYAIQQKGNSFSYADAGAAAQARANGVPELQSTGVQAGRGVTGIKNFMANTREMGPTEQQIQNAIAQREMNIGMQGFGINMQPKTPQRNEAQEAERQAVIKAATTPIAGARGMTANQLRTISDLQQGEDNRANDQYKTDANNAANVLQAGMRETGATARTAMQEQGSNRRFDSNLNFESQKFGATNDLENRKFGAEESRNVPTMMKQRAEINALQRYEQAKTPEEKQSAMMLLGALRGQTPETTSGKDRFMAVGGGQEWNDKAGAMVNRSQQLFDTQTQQYVKPNGQSASPYQDGQEVRHKDGKVYVIRNGEPVLKG